jgi:hypothetical protein
MLSRAIVLLPLLGWCCSRAGAVTQAPPATQVTAVHGDDIPGVPRTASAADQLRFATQCKLRLWRAQAPQVAEARALAVLAFRAVRTYFPDAPALGAEAAFRAGELLRAAADDAGARVEFDAACRSGAHTAFIARARIELGHIERRAGKLELALDAYLSVLMDVDNAARWRDEAGLAAGRVYEESARVEDARRLYQLVAEHGEDPLDRIRGFDAWAETFVGVDDVEAAAGVLAMCRNALASRAEEETELGMRVRNALERMRCIDSMELAVARRRKARAKAGEQ